MTSSPLSTLFVLASLLLPCALLATERPSVQRPNVIVIMTDDQGYGEFSCNGNPITRTPNIDALARAGVQLTDFHVAPMCTPTRGQFMTGLDAFRNNASNVSSGRTLLRADVPTIANVFHDAGYRTGLFGKWHLGDNYPYRPHDRGFGEAIWFPSSHVGSVPDYWNNDYFADTYLHRGTRKPFTGYCTDVFFREAAMWVAGGDRPFFAVITLNAAHWPWFVPERFREPVRAALDANPEVVEHLSDKQRENLVSFLAMGGSIDENVGRLDDQLKQMGHFDNTIVVFMTDNGSTMGQDYYNAGMRGKKTQLWEGGHRVPCFIRWPDGKLQAPGKIDTLCHVQDLLPTLAELAGIDDVPDDLDGVSLAPVLRGESDSVGDRMLVINYSRMPGMKVGYETDSPATPQQNGAAVLWRNWRLLENRELYNVAEDPHQDHDVASEHPDVVSKMREHLQSWWRGVKDQVMIPQRVIIGSDQENPMMLTACEWLDVFVDQQVQVRRGVRKNGVWHLIVDQPGTYQFELRRWPRESGLKLTERVDQIEVTDGTFPGGQAFAIADAKIRIGDFRHTARPDVAGQSVTFETKLSAGPTELQTWFRDADGKAICGAYYVYVSRRDERQAATKPPPRFSFVVHTIAQPEGRQFGQTSAVDIDRDGDLDFVSGQQAGQVAWYENPGRRDMWKQHVIGTRTDTDVGGVAFDVDRDGWIDQVSGGTWFRNPGDPTRANGWRKFDNGAIPTHDNLAADINGDGKTDLVSLIDKLGVYWYRIPDDATQPWIETKLIGPTDPPCHGGLAVGDVDGDGDSDVFRLDRWFENADGEGATWIERMAFDFGKIGPWGLQTRAELVDVDRDGDLDLIQAEGDVLDGRVAWFENLNGHGKSWEQHLIKTEGHRQDFHSLSVADFDGDGDVDIFTGGGPLTEGEHVWFIWENRDGHGRTWVEHVIARGHRTHESVAADVDGDGDIDLLTKPWSGNRHLLVENQRLGGAKD